MQDQPTVAELLEAVTAFVRDEAMPLLKDHAAFNARIAANVLEIVRRELARGPAAAAAEQVRLERLLGETGDLESLNRRLCERIARGDVGIDTPGLTDHLWQTVIDKVSIDQPGYATYKRLRDAG